jgi:hypothetical protein
MPFTFNGIGTTLYGARDFWPNGSHVTTEWVVIVWFPVVPLKSIRILPTGRNENYFFYRSTAYSIVGRQGLNLRQVLSVYGWVGLVAASVGAAAQWENWLLAVPAVLAVGAPWFLRRRAMMRMIAQRTVASRGKGQFSRP